MLRSADGCDPKRARAQRESPLPHTHQPLLRRAGCDAAAPSRARAPESLPASTPPLQAGLRDPGRCARLEARACARGAAARRTARPAGCRHPRDDGRSGWWPGGRRGVGLGGGNHSRGHPGKGDRGDGRAGVLGAMAVAAARGARAPHAAVKRTRERRACAAFPESWFRGSWMLDWIASRQVVLEYALSWRPLAPLHRLLV
jgi:hypothetical protein